MAVEEHLSAYDILELERVHAIDEDESLTEIQRAQLVHDYDNHAVDRSDPADSDKAITRQSPR
jgi:hypothetical protein